MHRHGQRHHPRQRRLALLLSLGLLALPLSEATAARAAAPSGAGGSSGGPETQEEALPPSTATQKALSEHLRRRGALFYGAWWCPACAQQKALFGQQGSQRLPYVECTDPAEGGRPRCEAAEIRAYPTWDLPGKPRLEGVQSLEELQVWSDFRPADGPAGGGTTSPAPQR